jgi:putative glycosyltransferase (TIGR04372 family)
MAVGHFEIIIDYHQICSALEMDMPKLVAFDSSFGVGQELSNLLKQRIPSLSVKNEIYADHNCVEWWAQAYLCDPHHYWFTPSTRKRVREFGLKRSLQRFRQTTKIAFLHMRTNAYKGSDRDPQQAIRSVNPQFYQSMVNRLIQDGYRVIVPKNANEELGLEGVTCIDISLSDGRSTQWKFFMQATFIIGTPSGMIHLSGLCDNNALFTNFTHLPSKMLGSVHLISMKRFRVFNPHLKSLSYSQRISLFLSHWIMPGVTSLTDYCLVTDLSAEDLVDNLEEFYQIAHDPFAARNLQQAINGLVLNCTFPDLSNFNISRTTMNDFLALLLFDS